MTGARDEELLRGIASGSEAAFAELYERYGQGLFRTAWGLLGSRDDAEDAVQDVFVGLVRARRGMAKVTNLKAYLFSALRHAAAKRRARIRRAPEPLPEEIPAGDRGRNPPGSAEISSRLEDALRALPAEQREVVALKVDGGLTFAEVAVVLNISRNTAASRYRYALEKLRAAMKTRGKTP